MESRLRRSFALIILCVLAFFLFFQNPKEPQPQNNLKKPVSLRHLTNRSDNLCKEDWELSLELFLPFPPQDKDHFEELGLVLLPSLALYWPLNNLNLLVVTDGEKATSGFNDSVFSLASDVGINTSVADLRLEYDFVRNAFPTAPSGWDRQQWLMFWADNFTSAEYVGFIDSDTVIVSPVMRSDLFVDNCPIIRGVYARPWYEAWPASSFRAVGKLEPMNCMTYFPVIIKTKHLPPMREHIRRTMEAVDFDHALQKLFGEAYSQFSIMCTYLWYFQHDEYYWTIRQNQPKWSGPYVYGQVNDTVAAGMTSEYFSRLSPSIANHLNIDYVHRDRNLLYDRLKRGYCFPMLTSRNAKVPRFCANYAALATKPNFYEWMWRDIQFWRDEKAAVAVHLKRMSLLNLCPRHWDRRLLQRHLNLTNHDLEPIA